MSCEPLSASACGACPCRLQTRERRFATPGLARGLSGTAGAALTSPPHVKPGLARQHSPLAERPGVSCNEEEIQRGTDARLMLK